ncbi:putative pentatricopeptide repeat-containing protein [Tanacetum coccineum]
MHETLVIQADSRIHSSFSNIGRHSIGLPLEFLKRFPRDGNHERFNVTCGLEITEKPVVKYKDKALWFLRLTGTSDVVEYRIDYKFYSPMHKGKRYRMSNASSYFQSVKNYPISGSQLTKNVNELSDLQDRLVSVNEGQMDVVQTRVSKFCDKGGFAHDSSTSKLCGQCSAKRVAI